MTSYRKKLIEVGLPLDDINVASAKEKSNPFLDGHPRSLHQWWARRPLPAARAVLFAQLVDDPGELGLPEDEVIAERERLFDIIRDLVKWENTTNQEVLERARAEIRKTQEREYKDEAKRALEFWDPFSGGGAIPLEAQRLGLHAHATDLNPVAVMINKGMVEIPPKFSGSEPINPEAQENRLISKEFELTDGLFEDIRYYGRWVEEQAKRKIGHLYPNVKITAALADGRPDVRRYYGQELPAIAWLWARTVKSSNPAFSHVDVPLISSFMLSTKKGKEAYVEPVIEGDSYDFIVRLGVPQDPTKTKAGTKIGRGASFQCILSGTPLGSDYIKNEGKEGRLGIRLIAVVVQGKRERLYLSPSEEISSAAFKAKPRWRPEGEMVPDPRAFTPFLYGLGPWKNLFTDRQLTAMTTFADLILDARQTVLEDAIKAGMEDDGVGLAAGGEKASAYADALALYLSFALSKASDYWTSLTIWNPTNSNVCHLFARQALPMTWDFPEANPIEGGLSIASLCESVSKGLGSLPANLPAAASLMDAASGLDSPPQSLIISTDPPYYDNVPYADLSDFFYVWLREVLKPIFRQELATMEVPKSAELVTTSYRHDSREEADEFFIDGMTRVMKRFTELGQPKYPITIYYAFKQSEKTKKGDVSSTGWETFLQAVLSAGLRIVGTWPIRTERASRMRGVGSNALATSIVLVCRVGKPEYPKSTRREFIAALKTEIDAALAEFQRTSLAPVDLAQAVIGPGMSVFSQFDQVVEADGNPMSVRSALQLINQTLDECMGEEENAFDDDTRFAVTWFETHQYAVGEFGQADDLARARNVSVAGVSQAGLLHASAGKVRLLTRDELASGWDPREDARPTIWEATQHLIKCLEEDGEVAAATLLSKFGTMADQARNLAYRLYTTCERRKWAEEARAYNGLVIAWPEIERLADGISVNTASGAVEPDFQGKLFG